MYVFRHGQHLRITVPDFTSPTSTALVYHDRDAVIVSTLGWVQAKQTRADPAADPALK